MTEKHEIMRGIAAYKDQQREVFDAIQRHGGRLHQDDFDQEFGDATETLLPNGDKVLTRKPQRLRVWPITRAAVVLGGMADARSMSDWGKMLDLAKLMAQAGLLRIEGEAPNVFYVAVNER